MSIADMVNIEGNNISQNAMRSVEKARGGWEPDNKCNKSLAKSKSRWNSAESSPLPFSMLCGIEFHCR